MRAVVSLGAGQSWDLPWGTSLIGSDPSCLIRLSQAAYVPPVAGVLFRWLNTVIVLGVGNPSHLIDNRGLPFRRHVVLARSAEQSLPLDGRHGPPIFRFRAGESTLTIHWQDVPAPGDVDDFAPDDLAAIMKAAADYSNAQLSKSPEGTTDSQLEALVARMTGAQSARVVPSNTPLNTLTLSPGTGEWHERTLTLTWRKNAPVTFVPEQVSQSVSHTLDDVLNTVAAGRPTSQDPPSYSGAVVDMPHFPLAIGSHWILSHKDFAHLELPSNQVLDSQALVTSIDGRVEVIDLADPPRLEVNGKALRRSVVSRDDAVVLAGVPMKARLRKVSKDRVYIPVRIFRILSQWADPISQIARLGLLLPHLETVEQRRIAHLIAALSGAQAGGVCAGKIDGSVVAFSPVFCQWSGDLDGSPFQSCTLLDKAIALALESLDGQFVAEDALRDSRLVESGATPADLSLPFWGPLAVLTRGRSSVLLIWRHPGESHFAPSELRFLQAILDAMEAGSLLVSGDLVPGPTRNVPSVSSPIGWLTKGHVRLPLAVTSRIGSDPACDLRISWDRSMSPWHCLILRDRENDRIMDFRSMHGTLVNRKEIAEAVLKENDRVLLGSTSLRFHYAEGASPESRQAAGSYLPVASPLTVDLHLVKQAQAFLQLGMCAGGAFKDRYHAIADAAARFLGGEAHLLQVEPDGGIRTVASSPEMPLPAAFLEGLAPKIEVARGQPLAAES